MEGFQDEVIAKLRLNTVTWIGQSTHFCPSLCGFLQAPDPLHIRAEKRWLGRASPIGNSTRGTKGPGDTPTCPFVVHCSLPSAPESKGAELHSWDQRASPGLLPAPWALQKQSKLAEAGATSLDAGWKGSIPVTAAQWLPPLPAANQPVCPALQSAQRPEVPLSCFTLELQEAVSERDTESLGGEDPGGGHGNPLQSPCLGHPRTEGLAGCCPWGRKESDTTVGATVTHNSLQHFTVYKAQVALALLQIEKPEALRAWSGKDHTAGRGQSGLDQLWV